MTTLDIKRPLSLAVLISGGGRTLLNLDRRIREKSLAANIRIVISSRPDVIGVERARASGIETKIIDRESLSAEVFQDHLSRAAAGVDLVCMAGFLSLWRIPEEFLGRVINIHPALLPDFGGVGMYGLKVHRAVLASGRLESGCTVHFCDNEYDHGPIILQRRVAVLPNDTPDLLAARVFEEECIAYPEAINQIAAGRVRYHEGKVQRRE
jgi:formyltetrahydrofolate-dependent phosphoribosylglycinamide formyltransferase